MNVYGRLLALVVAVALTACSQPAAVPSGADLPLASHVREFPVPCSALRYMRDLNRYLEVHTDPKTGGSLEYVVVGDGAASNDVIVFFPGTGQDIADWPIQLITNSTASPMIAKTIGYRASENGAVSLCHNYRLLFFDYPGVGLTRYRGETRDEIARDIDSLLQRVQERFQISTKTVDPLGWSLGTTFALKYAVLSPVSRPERTIHNVLLLAAGPGGSKQAQVGGDSAQCVQDLLNVAVSASGSLGNQIKLDATKLIFPYLGQKPRNNGTESNCRVSFPSHNVDLSVTPVCDESNGCRGYLDNSVAGLETEPWKHSNGVSGNAYKIQREQSNDFDVAYCSGADPGFKSTGCTAYGTIDQSVTNGGVCETFTGDPDEPVSSHCDRMKISGKVTVLYGYEDLFTQWTYDRALVHGLDAGQPDIAIGIAYPGSAGHGLLIQHPRWAQAQLATAMSQ